MVDASWLALDWHVVVDAGRAGGGYGADRAGLDLYGDSLLVLVQRQCRPVPVRLAAAHGIRTDPLRS